MWIGVTLTFDSSPIKGEGVYGWCCLVVVPVVPCPVDSRLRGNDEQPGISPPLWIADQVRNDGSCVVGVVLFHPRL